MSLSSTSSSIVVVQKDQKDDLTKDIVEQIFADCDKSGSGFINIKKLKVWFAVVVINLAIVMRALGLEPRQEEVNKLMNRMFEDSTARSVNPEAFTAQELFNILSDRLKGDKIGDEIQTAFQLFDSNEKGFINFEDLQKVAKELGEELNEDEFKEMILLAECSTKGQVTLNEFKNVMKKISLY
uniref:EF-hand domain-containing protein n=1 Tax=Meloidogyne hapla TaxID=6305 RepID=A0A1I8BWV2_MELHA